MKPVADTRFLPENEFLGHAKLLSSLKAVSRLLLRDES